MKIYNSVTNKIEEFNPIKEGSVSMYVCGPTVYNYVHIGNMRPVIFFDVVRRYFEYRGYNVVYASNVTDVDDKIINKAMSENVSEEVIAKKFEEAFFEDVKNAGSKVPHEIPHATAYIPEMIEFISKLIEKGYAYEADGDVYFRVTKIKNYGILSNQEINDLESGARISVEEKKENPLDFTLWKKTNEGIKWESPWGLGRPGWHTECVVMNNKIFGPKIDIHGGGVDLKFPHHENEIAQSIALNDNYIADYWMHVGRLDFGTQKMSKSLGNVIWAKDILKEYPYQALRMMILSSNYRSPISYNNDTMPYFTGEFEKINRTLKQAFTTLDLNDNFVNVVDEELNNRFINEMDNDFNTPNVITLVYEIIKKINVAIRNKDTALNVLYNTCITILDVLGIGFDFKRMNDEEKSLYNKWLEARKNKDFESADKYRVELSERGLI